MDETVRVIDWNDPAHNDFFLASQFWVSGNIYKPRADLVGFVNGLPLLFIELKKTHGKLEREFAREYHLITRDDRLEKVAEDLVAHFMGREQGGKGLAICIDKLTAVKMYEKVRKHWGAYLADLKAEFPLADAHLKRQVMGREVVVAITNGRLDLGTWEQIFYGEFDGHRPKRVLVKVIGE